MLLPFVKEKTKRKETQDRPAHWQSNERSNSDRERQEAGQATKEASDVTNALKHIEYQ